MNLLKPVFYASCLGSLFFSVSVMAAIIPTGNQNNSLYYKIGGGSDFALPPVENTQTIHLNANTDLGTGYACGAFNPMASITNTFKNIKNSADNIGQGIIQNATGSLAEMPMYFLAQANPTAYNLLNNTLLSAHKDIAISTTSCQQAKQEISKGENPYKDWGAIAVGDAWKKQLSLTANDNKDINQAKKDVDKTGGDNGVPWVQGAKLSNASGDSSEGYYAGGLNQPPIHVIGDTVKAGYNALLLRVNDLNDNTPAPAGGELAKLFPTPNDAVAWITNVVGDLTVTTCQEASCKSNQRGVSGRGLLPWITSCNAQNKNYCVDTIRSDLTSLIAGQTPINKTNLEAVSASNLIISPQVISAIQNMNSTQQMLIISKLAQEVATQKAVDRALVAKNILQTGSQVPVIASNKPAQLIIQRAIAHLNNDVTSLAFESNIRKHMMSNTVSEILHYSTQQQAAALQVAPVTPNAPLMDNSALPSKSTN